MPPSTKRSQRTRRETINNVDVPDSSPSRPAKRRKKVEEPVEPPPPPALPIDQDGIELDDNDIVNAVIPFLNSTETPVQAAQDHANEIYKAERNVSAFAKLSGKDWTFYITKIRNVLGRPPENAQPGTTTVDIDLGPSKHISRQHAEISYDSDAEQWYIEVVGRNPIKIDGEKYLRSSKTRLVNGQIIEIGGIEMMFALPMENEKLQIHPTYLERAGLIQPVAEVDQDEEGGGSSTSTAPDSASHSATRGQIGVQGGLPIAPAPPDYRRSGTPVNARSKGAYSVGKSPGFPGSTMLMNSDDVDLSLESNAHIKPSYSYAQLISQAILEKEEEKVTLSGIYSFIVRKYAYYRAQPSGGWQNSIRHNLSLNKAFEKLPRTSDEPGKGMKWHIVDSHRDEMARNCVRGGRGGHRGSPGGSSPGNLNSSAKAKAGSEKRSKRSTTSGSPPSNRPSKAIQYTPDRNGRLAAAFDDAPGDGSPLPRHRRQTTGAFGLSDNVAGSEPVLSSSYMQDEASSFVTPAPLRVHPRLAPPSTAQRPSQHMPTSSPAPFWKFVDYGNTPMKGPAFDSSPIKPSNAAPDLPPSSSPLPVRRSSAASPIRNTAAVKIEEPIVEDIEEEDQGFDLTKGFQTIGSYHAPAAQGLPIPEPSLNGINGTNGVNGGHAVNGVHGVNGVNGLNVRA